jgi:5-methylcytosine-specific restriction endonuclease McrA
LLELTNKRKIMSANWQEEYGDEWEWLKGRVLDANPNCADCGWPAETVHHLTYKYGIICPEKYLVTLCWECHNRRHGKRSSY